MEALHFFLVRWIEKHWCQVKAEAQMSKVCSSNSGSRLLNSGRRLLNSGSRLLNSGRRLLNSGSRLLNSGSRLLNSGSRLLNSGRRLLNSGSRLLNLGSHLLFLFNFNLRRIKPKHKKTFHPVKSDALSRSLCP